MTVAATPPRVRPAIRKLAIIAVILLVPTAAFSIWDAIEARHVAADVEDIVRRGEPVTMGGRAAVRNMTAGQREAARLYYAAAVLGSGINRGSIQRRVQTAALADLAERTRPATELLMQLAAARALHAADLATLEAVYAPAAPAFDLIDRAASLDFAAFTLDRAPYSLLTSDLLQLRALSAVRTDALTLRGDPAAVMAQTTSIRLERAVPTMWSRPSSTGSLTLLLGRGTWDGDALRRLQDAYETASDTSADDLINLRAQILESVWPDAANQPRHLQRMRIRDSRLIIPGAVLFVLRPWLTHQLHNELRIWRETIDAVNQPWPERRQAIRALSTKYPEGKRRSLWMPMAPYPAAAVSLTAETIPRAAGLVARNRTSAAAIAVERYRLDHGGAVPETLGALVPAYFTAVPQDPFVGGPVRLWRTDNSYAVYSVGIDEKDDRGDVDPYHPDADWSYRPKGRDLGIRVPLTPRR